MVRGRRGVLPAVIVVAVLLGGCAGLAESLPPLPPFEEWLRERSGAVVVPEGTPVAAAAEAPAPVTPAPQPTPFFLMPDAGDGAPSARNRPILLGRSTLGHPIRAYVFGRGERRVAFVGGIHGGFEWNTAILAYQAIDHFTAHPELIPDSVTLYIIPVANPDGLQQVTGKVGRFAPEDVTARTLRSRFNGNGVDLNRNWACAWQPRGFLGGTRVNAGSAAMSEPETKALAGLFSERPMEAVIVWHSALGAVYAGGCEQRHAGSDALATLYAEAAGYPFRRIFTGYRITGDATDWLALKGVPALTVELSSHRRPDWEQNLAGMLATLEFAASTEQE